MHRDEKSGGGFTLVEVMVATLLISMAIAGGVASLIQGNRMIEDARHMTRVSQIIQSEVEALRTLTWSDFEDMPSFAKIPLQGNFAQRYANTYFVYRYVYNYNSAQKSVYLYVTWYDAKGNYKWQWYYTRFTENGLNDYFYRAF